MANAQLLLAEFAPVAPALRISQWLNSEKVITLDQLRGRVVLVHAFQMLCPGCVMTSMPQAVRTWQHYRSADAGSPLVVLGLHTVFEHHAVMTPAALAVYLYEFRIPFPVAVDAAGTEGPIPQTMSAYGTQGTPTTLLIDGAGRLRKVHFGVEPDEQVIADIDALIGELRIQ